MKIKNKFLLWLTGVLLIAWGAEALAELPSWLVPVQEWLSPEKVNVNASQEKETPKSQAKNTPEVAAMLAAYQQQQHRIAFQGCEMFYNDKPFNLDMTVERLIKVFGPYDFFSRGLYVWEGAGIVVATKSSDENTHNVIKFIEIHLNDLYDYDYEQYKEELKHRQNKKKDIFLLAGVPIDYQTRVTDFFQRSFFEFSDFAISDSSFKNIYDCEGRKVSHFVTSRGNWIYKGGGHLMLKSHINRDNQNVFGSFSFSYINE